MEMIFENPKRNRKFIRGRGKNKLSWLMMKPPWEARSDTIDFLDIITSFSGSIFILTNFRLFKIWTSDSVFSSRNYILNFALLLKSFSFLMWTISRLWVSDCNSIRDLLVIEYQEHLRPIHYFAVPFPWISQLFDWAAVFIKPKPIKNFANIFEFVFHDEPHLKNSFQLWKNLKSTNRNLKQLFRVLATWNKHLFIIIFVHRRWV